MTDDYLACITQQLPDFHGCTTRDTHYGDLLANDPDHANKCNGCLPRRANYGLVCNPCYGRIAEAIEESARWFELLEGVDRALQKDASGATGKPGSRVPIAPVPLTAEELRSYLRTFRGTVERWVADPAGAADAVRFARAMEAAARNHPTAETPHKIRRTRCPRCELLTLVWNPPQYFGGHVSVTCRNDECGFEADQSSFEKIAAIERVA